MGVDKVTAINGKRVTTVDGVRLSPAMASILIAHASGERSVTVSDWDTLKALKARRLIRYNRFHKPSHTVATQRGREVIAALLARLAQALSARQLET